MLVVRRVKVVFFLQQSLTTVMIRVVIGLQFMQVLVNDFNDATLDAFVLLLVPGPWLSVDQASCP
jgi:hypothetical protein